MTHLLRAFKTSRIMGRGRYSKTEQNQGAIAEATPLHLGDLGLVCPFFGCFEGLEVCFLFLFVRLFHVYLTATAT